MTSDSYPNGLVTKYTYDAMGEVLTETDPPVTDRVTGAVHKAQTTFSYDTDGDVTSQTVADASGGDASRTATSTYNSHDQLATSTDPAGATTSYTYDAYGNLNSQTDPAGNTTGYLYDADGHLKMVTLTNYTGNPASPQAPAPLVESSRAYDPDGRLASITDSMGNTTSYTYTDNGLLATATRTGNGGGTFTEQSNTYNAANQLTQQVTNNGGTTTAYTVDAAGRNTSVTVDPAGLDRTTAYSYSPDDQVVNQTLTGSGSSTPVQSTSYTYDPMGNMTSQSVALQGGGDPAGWWRLDQTSGNGVTDASGTGHNATASNVTWSGGAGSFDGADSQVATNGPVLDSSGSFSVSAWVKLASAGGPWQGIAAQSSANEDGFRLQYEGASSGIGNWGFDWATADTSSNPVLANAKSSSQAAVGTWTHLVGTYDASTGTMTLYVNGTAAGTATDTTPFASSGPLTVGADEWKGSPADWLNGSVSDVQVYQRVLSSAEVRALHQAGRDGGANPANQLTTSWALDKRGLPTSMTDPNGNTTYYTYDEAGRLAVTTSPAVSTQVHGGPVVQASPVTMTGYDTFGEPAESDDPDGNVTVTGYDADGRPVSVTQPPYTPPGSSTPVNAVSTTAYNSLGEVTSQTSPLGGRTSYTYDQLGDTASVTAPNGGVTSYTYDTNGDQLSMTSPTGAVTGATYDYLGRQVTSTQVERYPSAAAYTTNYAYGTGGWLSSQTTPDGVQTSYGYDAAGERTSVTDGVGNITSYGYDPAGRLTSTTYPNATASTNTYDEANRLTGQADLSNTGTVLRSDASSHDGDGNLTSSTDYNGNITSYAYDNDDRLVSQNQPVSSNSAITTTFGYDAAGNRTLYQDGNGNDWWTTYNSWNLPESQIEPPTTAQPGAANGTFTTAYDADGNPVSVTEPSGATTITNTYNTSDQLTAQSGAGAGTPTATRNFGYDLAGNLTSASTTAAGSAPATSENFTYDDRGLPLSASGSAGSSSFGYNGDGQATSVTDAAGTTGYTYDADGRLGTLADPLTGRTASYSYNPLSQPSKISYGTGNDVRTFSYNSLHEMTGDNLATSGGQGVASISYGYDSNGNLTSKNTTGFAGASANTYAYDDANRLTSWTSGATSVGYAYDGAGNRTQAGNEMLTYDARDELISTQVGSGQATAYAYTARGTLKSVTAPSGTVVNYASNAYGQPVTQGTQSFTYDALGRAVSDTGTGGSYTLGYVGQSNQVAADGAWDYSYDPSGGLAAIGPAGGTTAQGVLAYTDQHTDLVGTFAPSGATLSGSASYSPLGTVTASSGLAGNLGYQSGFTDPSSNLVNMGARWYTPATGEFTTRDTAAIDPAADPADANPFAYVGDNPLTGTDPSGHYLVGYGSSGGHSNWRPPPPPPPPPCPWWDAFCHAVNIYHHYVAPYVHHVVHIVVVTMAEGLRHVTGLLSAAAAMAGHLTHDVETGLADAARQGAHAVAAAWRATAAAGAAVTHQVTRWASHTYHQAEHAVSDAWHAAAHAASAVTNFVKHHAATIAAFAVSAAVFAGCDAALGIPTGGVGALAGASGCSALAGAAGNAVSYGITAAQTGHFSWTGLADSAATGALAGAAGGMFGGLAASGLSVIGDAATSLLSDGAQSIADDASSSLAATGVDDTAALASPADSADISGAAGNANLSDAPDEAGLGPSCGGRSFTAGTKVLLATGAAVPIAKLHHGQKVLATNTRTGKTRPEPIAAVLVHHDTNRYNLKVRTGNGADVLDTTRSHLFWDEGTGRWVKAGALKYGTHLRTPGNGTATVLGGYTPRQVTGWMWDLTVTNDHDFYVQAADTAVLAHNCGGLIGSLRGAFNEAKRLVNVPRAWLNNRALAKSLGGVPPEPNATVGDLLDMVPGNPQRAEKLAAGLARSNEDMLNSVFAPGDNQFIATNPSMPNTILQGNHRVYQLLLRAADPENTSITYDTPIFINKGDW